MKRGKRYFDLKEVDHNGLCTAMEAGELRQAKTRMVKVVVRQEALLYGHRSPGKGVVLIKVDPRFFIFLFFKM